MISVVIRVLNEARHLADLLSAVKRQETGGQDVEIVIVDSGSIDGTLEIAVAHGCRILRIAREEFSFGRSLNIGCAAARGQYLAFTSGHCIPVDEHWLARLVEPLILGLADYTYGRQIGGDDTKFSEHRLFAKYFPSDPALAQAGFFCNNANAAIKRDIWEQYRFDEGLTGLEDMELAKRCYADGHKITYCPGSVVYHYHRESWRQVRRRYEREALALQKIMPEVHFSSWDFVRCVVSAVWLDTFAALKAKRLRELPSITLFRLMQYSGTFSGNHIHRRLSQHAKERYFYPNARSARQTTTDTMPHGLKARSTRSTQTS